MPWRRRRVKKAPKVLRTLREDVPRLAFIAGAVALATLALLAVAEFLPTFLDYLLPRRR